MRLSDEILAKLKDTLNRVAPDARVILYGSYARGDAKPHSDIDLLILLPDSYEDKEFIRKKFAISDNLYDLSLEIGIEISPLVVVNKIYHSRKTLFTVNVANEGIPL